MVNRILFIFICEYTNIYLSGYRICGVNGYHGRGSTPVGSNQRLYLRQTGLSQLFIHTICVQSDLDFHFTCGWIYVNLLSIKIILLVLSYFWKGKSVAILQAGIFQRNSIENYIQKSKKLSFWVFVHFWVPLFYFILETTRIC